MTEMIFKLLGGIGLFLMGMVMLTDGLKAFAGDSLRTALLRFTGSPLKAFGAGTFVTLLVQSSSATTVAVIGFVSAGLLTFPQAIGIVFGASLGTTGTGWIVSVLGLKISVGLYALPLVGVGAFIKLMAPGWIRPLGMALAGFGLIFIGIETLQVAMQSLTQHVDLGAVPSSGLFGHALMMIIGIIMTILMQSSSAAVATTLTALHAGSITFEQAASLVIGAAIGTTVTGAIAAIGGSVAAKRTAAAHVTFNLATGIIAMLLLPVFLWLISLAQKHMGLDAGATSLAAFHTSFILLGVVIFLPFVDRFSALIERIVPDQAPTLTQHLDPSLLSIPSVALEATRRALSSTAGQVIGTVDHRLANGKEPVDPKFEEEIDRALSATKEFFAKIPPVNEDSVVAPLRVAQIHAIEHLMRLLPFLNPAASLRKMINHPRLQDELLICRELMVLAVEGLAGQREMGWVEEVKTKSLELSELRKQERPAILEEAANSKWNTADALEMLDAMRWLDSVGYHVWRICNYLASEVIPESEAGQSQQQP